jgi:hypothetical protein
MYLNTVHYRINNIHKNLRSKQKKEYENSTTNQGVGVIVFGIIILIIFTHLKRNRVMLGCLINKKSL